MTKKYKALISTNDYYHPIKKWEILEIIEVYAVGANCTVYCNNLTNDKKTDFPVSVDFLQFFCEGVR